MTDIRPRLWETLRIGAELFDADPSHTPETVVRLASEITIDVRDGGFVISNASWTYLLVLVTLMAKATGSSADEARTSLSQMTSFEVDARPRRAAPGSASVARVDPWRADVQIRQRPTGQWVATRSGTLVLPLETHAQHLVSQRTPERGGVVVVAVAAIGDGAAVEAGLMGVSQAAFATLGERPTFA